MTRPTIDALVLSGVDNVATALRELSPGETVSLGSPEGSRQIRVSEAIPLCHKLALRPIERGAKITKYGETIGEATAAIAAGAHVHVHNLRSWKGRK